MESENPLKYYSFMLKFVMKRYDALEKIVIIYDDLESHNPGTQRSIIQYANQVHQCLKTTTARSYDVKSLISLRSFTFREHIDRQRQARRQIIEHSVILKKEIPPLDLLFQKRFETAQAYANTLFPDADLRGNLENARAILITISKNLNINFGNMIARINNNNIFDSLNDFMRIITNHRYITPRQIENEGAYSINIDDYHIDRTEPVFRALALGEDTVYRERYHSICNILSVHNETCPNTELIGLYIINYFLSSKDKNADNAYLSGNDIYGGTTYEVGSVVINRILSLYSDDVVFHDNLKVKLEYFMSLLYANGVLLRSILDYEDASESVSQTQRVYHSDYGLYLSWRGQELFSQLKSASYLFEVLRDDIDTDNIEYSHVPTEKLQTKDRLLYLIRYTKYLFNEFEKVYIQKALNSIGKYQQFFGNKFIVGILLEGVAKSIESYYRIKDAEYENVRDELCSLIKDIKEYEVRIRASGSSISIQNYLKSFYQRHKGRLYTYS